MFERVMKRDKLIAISWASSCSRSDGLAERLGGRSFMVYSPLWGSRYSTILFKYAVQAIKTLRILFKEKPQVIIVMAPPVVSCLPVWIYCRLSRAVYVIDAHTAAFVDRRWRAVMFLQRFFSRRAVATISTNTYLADIVRGWQAHAVIVSDVPVFFPEPARVATKGSCCMTFVSSFTQDEPLIPFIAAAGALPDIQFYVTGDYKAANPKLLEGCPPNVSFTGYLPRAEYVGLLLASAAVISLTTLDHTMQRGAYEAIFLEKPVITSDFPLLKQIFYKGAVHVANTDGAIVAGIVHMKNDLQKYKHEAIELKAERLEHWHEVQRQLCELLVLENRAEIRNDAAAPAGTNIS